MRLARILEQLGGEPALTEYRLHVIGRHQKIIGRIGGPRQGKVGRCLLAGGHLLEGEPATRLQDASNFLVKGLLVSDIHADILHPGKIE